MINEDRVTRAIPEASVCVQRKPDRARCPVTNTLQHAWEPVRGRNHMTDKSDDVEGPKQWIDGDRETSSYRKSRCVLKRSPTRCEGPATSVSQDLRKPVYAWRPSTRYNTRDT